MPFLLSTQDQYAGTWQPTVRTHLLHAGVAAFFFFLMAVSDVPFKPAQLTLTCLGLACLPLASVAPVAGATVGLTVSWISLAEPHDMGPFASQACWGAIATLLARSGSRTVAYLFAAVAVILNTAYAPEVGSFSLFWPAVVGLPCMTMGEIIRHHHRQADAQFQARQAELERLRELVTTELHNTVVRDLSHVIMTAERSKLAHPDNVVLARELDAVIAPARTAVRQLRGSLRAMSTAGDDSIFLLASSPPTPVREALEAARDALQARGAQISVAGLELLEDDSIPPGLHQQLVRILDELLDNIGKYAAPDGPASLIIEVDDGVIEFLCSNAVAPSTTQDPHLSSGIGLERARRRTKSLGGTFEIDRTDSRWRVSVSVPIPTS